MSDWFGEPGTDDLASVSVVIVTHNSGNDITRAIQSIPGATVRPVQIVVVDTGSSDDSVDRARGAGPAVQVIDAGVNLGFARACNLAVEHATGTYVLFLNPDTRLDPGSLDLAVDALETDSTIGVVGGRSRYDDGSLNDTCCFGAPSLWSAVCFATGLTSVARRSALLNPEGMGGWDRDDDRDVDVVTGCFLLMRRAQFESLGGFDERFFLYSEDTDLCARVRAIGLRCVHLARVGFVHSGGGSDVVRSAKLAKVFRAKRQLYDKNWSRPAAALGGWLIDAAVVLRVVSGTLTFSRRRGTWRQIWAQRALWHDLENDPFDVPPVPDALRATPSPAGRASSGASISPDHRRGPRTAEITARIAYRLVRHIVRSARSGDRDFVRQGASSLLSLPALVVGDLVGDERHECNVCGWRGHGFYPNTGPGYHIKGVTCPGCSSLDRHRSLLALLLRHTGTFVEGTKIVEVAPMRGFEAMLRSTPGIDYTSFDLERHAMERGDITAMRWADDEIDVFLCFHVLEHIPDEKAALQEILRVLAPGGVAVLQVPVDWEAETTVEYGAPDPRDVGHVRRYGRDFVRHLTDAGFEVEAASVLDELDADTIVRFGLSPEPIVFARKPLDG